MIGMDTVIALRRQGMKPSFVMVDLVTERSRFATLADHGGTLTIEILPNDRIGDIDFRPLFGLYVHLQDMTDDAARLKAAGKAIAEVKPGRLVMAFPGGSHVLTSGNPPTTETYRYA